MTDQLEAKVEAQLNAVDMEPNKIYLNSAGKIKIRLSEKVDGVVWVYAWSEAHREWRKVKVDETYKVKLPTKGEMAMVETAEKEVKVKKEKVKAEPKGVGAIRKLKMLATWGQVYKDVGEQGLEAVKAEMLKEFPDKADSIERWAIAYRIYYNTGRLPGVEKPATPIIWPDTARDEKNAEKAAKAMAKLQEKEAKAKLKAEEKAAKLAKKAEQAANAEVAAGEQVAP